MIRARPNAPSILIAPRSAGHESPPERDAELPQLSHPTQTSRLSSAMAAGSLTLAAISQPGCWSIHGDTWYSTGSTSSACFSRRSSRRSRSVLSSGWRSAGLRRRLARPAARLTRRVRARAASPRCRRRPPARRNRPVQPSSSAPTVPRLPGAGTIVGGCQCVATAGWNGGEMKSASSAESSVAGRFPHSHRRPGVALA